MANRTVSDAIAIHGTNPQYLIEKIIRSRIYDSLYWKESCFGLTAETLIDRAAALTSFGGQYGNQKPTEFLCLVLKLLQLQPGKDIVVEFLRNEDHKYLRALGAFYLRLVGTSLEIYQYLEPLLNDYRKLRRRTLGGDFDIISMDEFIDELLREERVCDTIMPRITKRYVLEENEELPPRISALEEDLEDEEDEVDFLSKSEKSADRDNHREKDDYEFHQNSRPRSRSISLSSRGERPPRKYRDLSRDAYERGRTRRSRSPVKKPSKSYSMSRSRSRSISRSRNPRRSYIDRSTSRNRRKRHYSRSRSRETYHHRRSYSKSRSPSRSG